MSEDAKILDDIGQYKYGFHDPDNYVFKSQKGLSREVVENISRMKDEPKWMLDFRLKALDHFMSRPMPTWGPDISGLHLDDIFYYVKPTEGSKGSWDDVPETIKNTFDKLGIPEAERKFLAGVGAQYECLSSDARIYTTRGVVPIRSILPGDVVFALEETANTIVPAPVKAILPKGERPVFEVKVGTRVIRATENHPFLVMEHQLVQGHQRGHYVRTWKYLRELRPGDLVAVARSLPAVGQSYTLEQPAVDMNWLNEPVYLPDQTTIDLMWWSDLYMGNGYFQRESNQARVELAIPETEQRLRTEPNQATSKLLDVPGQNRDPYRITTGSTAIARYLEASGFSGGAHEKRVPNWVASNRMMFSGDFGRSDFRSEPRLTQNRKRKFKKTYSSAEDNSSRSITNEWFGYDKIDSIEPAGIESVYDIEVDGPHNFVAEGLIVHNSEMVYHSILDHLEKQGVIFLSIEDGLRQHPDLFREYFGTVIPIEDNKFAALNSAVWSGGSFVYVPKGIKVDLPLQAYFRLNTANVGQFERSLIIVDEDASVHYVEGCFLAGARVRTRKGEKPIEETAVGDEVLTHLGRWRKVYHTQKRPYHGNIYHIHYYGDSDRTLRVTAEHPLLVVRRKPQSEPNKEYQHIWARADSVKSGDYLVVPVYQPETELVPAGINIEIRRGNHASIERQFDFPQEPDFYRLLGYYFSEGHVDNKHNLSLSFNANETDLLADANNLVERYFTKTPATYTPRENGQTLLLPSTETARAFTYEFGASVYKKSVPEWILNASADLLVEFIHGMWLGNGSYDARKNVFRYNSISVSLAYAFRDALMRLGIAASVNLQKRLAPRKDIYTVVIASPFNLQFGEIVGLATAAGDLQSSPLAIDENFLYVPINEIVVEEQETEVYNFSVEEDESYVAEGVVSHNCTAPQYTTNSFHSGVIEIIVKRGARSRYSTIQNWSHNVYNLVTQRAKVYGNATHEWVDANMGCLAEGSTVTTPEGIKPIELLEEGDRVLSYDEATEKLCFREVTAKRFSGNQPVHTVSIGERKLRVTANHPFYSYVYNPDIAHESEQYHFVYMRADQLKEVILPRTSLDYGQPHFLTMPDLETRFDSFNQYASNLGISRQRNSLMTIGEYTSVDLMWMFGYWVGDGNMDIKPAETADMIRFAQVGFSTPREDRAQEELVSVMETVLDVEPTERPDGNHLAWNSRELVEFFKANGFYGKAGTKRIPQWVWSVPEKQRLAFVAGYLDANGYVNEDGAYIHSSNRNLLEDIASLLVTLGITSRLYTEFSEPRTVNIFGVECTARGAYRLTFAADTRFVPYLNLSLQEKVLALRPPKIQFRRTVGRSQLKLSDQVEVVSVEVSPATQETIPTWDIEVAGTGNFISQGFIVHNSKLTMKYPSCYLMEPGAHGEMLSMAFAGPGQIQDAGSKMIHFAPNTTSKVTSKSISRSGGRASFRGLLKVYKGAKGSKSNVVCDALLLDPDSRTDTYPTIEIDEDDVSIGHEASVSKVGEEQLFYLMSRGLSQEEATTMVVSGFIEPLVKELPMEYAVEMNRLIQLQMEGSVG